MSSMTSWTQEDIAQLTEKALHLALLTPDYCDHCTVAAILPGEKYCRHCANIIAQQIYAAYYDALAQEYMEALNTEKGLY